MISKVWRTGDEGNHVRRTQDPAVVDAGNVAVEVSAGINPSRRAADHPRSGRRPRIAVACSGVLVWACLFAAPAHANPSALECGSVVTTNTKLGQDLSNCPGDGLVVGADNITVNLNGHTIGGDGVPNTERPDAGIWVDGHARVTISNGSVAGFDLDVLFGAAPYGTVSALTVKHSRRGMLFVEHSDGARILGNTATNNGGPGGGAGIVLLGSSGATIRGNTVTGNHVGVALNDGANSNIVTGNMFTDIDELAVGIGFSDDNIVTFNRITRSSGGVVLESSGTRPPFPTTRSAVPSARTASESKSTAITTSSPTTQSPIRSATASRSTTSKTSGTARSRGTCYATTQSTKGTSGSRSDPRRAAWSSTPESRATW